MPFPPSFIDELVARNPIEEVVGQYVSLKRSGANLFGLCPFHGEKTASFSVNPEKGIYYCFGCHKGGGVINFEMEIEGLSYPDAVRALAKRAGLDVPDDAQYQSRYRQQERLWALCKEAARFYHAQLYEPSGAAGLAYAQKRGMSKGVLTAFGIGFAPDSYDGLRNAMRAKGYTDAEMVAAGLLSESQRKTGAVYDRFRNRLMFPIIDVRGNVIGFGGRVMDSSTPKYLNSPETLIFNKRKNLFALNIAKKSKLGYLILVEGYMDAISLHQYGFDCAVASLGTALTEDGANLLSKYTEKVILIYDGDTAGQNATQRAIPILERAGITVQVLQMRDAKDPDEYLKRFGADRFRLLLADSSNRVEYQLRVIEKKYDLSSDEERVKFLQESAQLIATLSPVRREVYGRRAAEAAGIGFDAFKIEVDRAYKRLTAQERRKREQAEMQPARNLQPKAASMRYDNIRSAMAEETLLGQLLREPALFDRCQGLSGSDFTAPFLGRAYDQLLARHRQGLEVSVSVLEDFSAEEISHLVGVQQRGDGPVSEQAVDDCLRTIRAQREAGKVTAEEDLLAFRNKLKERKGL
ncbi:MAG: DNA primase [Firmicutes bacterium]|nr:DNA primase [Bacillota bacterium]